MFIESPDNFLDDFGVPCSQGATNFTGLLDMPDQTFDLGGTSIQSSEYSLTFRTGIATFLNGDVVTVSGVSYVARGPANKLDDGVFSAIKMSRV
jgi:hypothetical protein